MSLLEKFGNLLGGKSKEREILRVKIQEAYGQKLITQTEHDLIWDLTWDKANYNLARYYLATASFKRES